MANIASRLMQYTDDFGIARRILFKIKDAYKGQFPEYVEPDGACGQAIGGFQHRYLRGVNLNGEVIKFPVPTRALIPTYIAALTTGANAQFACVDLIGEEQSVFPGLGTQTATYALPNTGVANKRSGAFQYVSDLLGTVSAKFSTEEAPTAISNAVIQCLGPDVTENTDSVAVACALNLDGFRPRRIIAIASNTTSGGKIVRRAPSSATNPLACRTAMAAVAQCVGYEGESIRNANLILAQLNP